MPKNRGQLNGNVLRLFSLTALNAVGERGASSQSNKNVIKYSMLYSRSDLRTAVNDPTYHSTNSKGSRFSDVKVTRRKTKKLRKLRKAKKGRQRKSPAGVPNVPNDYRGYIESLLWRKRKEAYYQTHPKRCAACDSYRVIQLHHIVYRSYGNETDDELIPLCLAHHKAYRYSDDRNRQLVSYEIPLPLLATAPTARLRNGRRASAVLPVRGTQSRAHRPCGLSRKGFFPSVRG